MTLNHIHLQVQDLRAAVNWFEKVMQVYPGFRNERMATFLLNSMTLILDEGDEDTVATVGFESDDCDRDFQMLLGRGAEALEAPANRPWGIRTSYFKGPGAMKFEIEGPVTNR